MAKLSLDELASHYVCVDQSNHAGRWKRRARIRKQMVKRFGHTKTFKAIAQAEETFKLLCPPPPPPFFIGIDPISQRIKWYTGLQLIQGSRPKFIIMDDLTP